MVTIKKTTIDEYTVHMTLSDGRTVLVIPKDDGLLLNFCFADVDKVEQTALNQAKITYKERKVG